MLPKRHGAPSDAHEIADKGNNLNVKVCAVMQPKGPKSAYSIVIFSTLLKGTDLAFDVILLAWVVCMVQLVVESPNYR